MDKCDCWHKEERIVGWCGFSPLTKTVYECYGTKEREECQCMGDRGKCDFYQEVREKAKKVPATIGEAISHFTMGITHNIFNEPVTSYANLAIEALRQMQEKEQNEPLTLDELRKGVDYPLYIVYPKNSDKDHWVIEDCWDTEFDEMCDAKGNAWYGCYYGITWLAYRRKPKEEHHEAD